MNMENRNLKSAFDPVAPSNALRKKVLEMKRPAVPGGNRLLRLAAVAATLAILLTAAFWPGRTQDGQLITAPGVIKVYAYDLSSGTDISGMTYQELEKGVELPYEFGWHITTNVVPGLPIKLSMPEDIFEGAKITFEVTVNGGEFFRELGKEYGEYVFGPAYLGQKFLIENDQIIYWHCYQYDLENWKEKYDEEKVKAELKARLAGETTGYELPKVSWFTGDKAYLDIIIRADEHIVGCMKVLIYAEPQPSLWEDSNALENRYYAKLLGSVYCPKQDGEYQNVSREQVQKMF